MRTPTPFEWDIFISYAHVDNKRPDPDQEGWISYFHKCLNLQLAKLCGAKPRIWRDNKLRGDDYFPDEIVDQFRNVAFLVSILSPSYVESEWCLRELETFCNTARQTDDPRLKNKARVFKVVKTPVSLGAQPDIFHGLLGYDFFHLDDDEDPVEYDLLINEETKKDFWKVLNGLARDVSNQMRAINAEAPSKTEAPSDTPSPSPAPRDDRKTIFLANTGFDLTEAYRDIKRVLEAQECRVLPDGPLPTVISDFEKQVPEMLARCDLAVHMIGAYPGMKPDGADKPIVALQNELAVQRSAQGPFPRLIWMPPALETDDNFQHDFIQHLRSDQAMLHGADLLESSLDGLKLQLQRLLNPEPKPDLDEKNDDEARQVYLIFDQQDLEVVTPLAETLYDEGLGVVTPAFEGDPKDVRDLHQEHLRTCDAALIYFGAAKGPWFQQKLIELRKIFGLGRSAPFLTKYIFVTEPKTPDKALILTRDAKVIKHYAPFTPDVLRPFLAELR